MKTNARRAARQERSKATVEAIFEATARVLESKGMTALSTNQVATLAGVSIGSLYEYFDNKEALLRAWCERHISEVKETVDHLFSSLAETPPKEAIEIFIEGLFLMNQTRPKLRQVLIEEAPKRLGLNPLYELDCHVERRITEYLKGQSKALRDIDIDAMSYTICRAGKAVATSVVIEEQPPERIAQIRASLIDLIQRAFLP
jgi:AcrR family transcriptional regulator